MPKNTTTAHVLVTGFEPFDGDAANPSREVAKQLDGARISGHEVRALVLPVQHEAARERLSPALAAPGLAAALMLGLAGGRARVSIERVAVNVMDYSIPDAAGRLLTDTPCVARGPAAHLSTLPIREVLAALIAEGIPAHISNTAGTYLCNYTLYTALHALARRSRRVPAGFIHLPYLPSMVAAHGLEQPSMDLSLAVRAAELALRAAVAPRRREGAR